MTVSINTPEDVANLALTRIGYQRRIANLYEGSPQANAILNIYAQTRDEVLMGFDWGFAEGNIVGTLQKSAPVGGYGGNAWNTSYPPLPFLFQYAYPADCLKIRAVKPTPVFLPNFQPQPFVWSVDNDATLTPPAKAISCNVANAIIVYTRQVLAPSEWESDFIEALAASIARRVAPVLVNADMEKMEAADEMASLTQARTMEG